MTRSDLPLFSQLLLAKTEGMIARIVNDADDPQARANELMADPPQGSELDIRVFNGSQESLSEIGTSYAEKAYTGVLKTNKEDDSNCSLVVCQLTPPMLKEILAAGATDTEADTPTDNGEATTDEVPPLRVFRAEPLSLAEALILVAARDRDQAIAIIDAELVVATDFLNIEADEDYNGITGEPRILEAVGFDCQCSE